MKMNLIMNERKFAEELLNGEKNIQSGSYVTSVLAKYYKNLDHSDKVIAAEIEQILIERFPDSSPQTRKRWIKNALKKAKGNPLYEIDQVTITKPEMEKIEAIHSDKFQDRRVKMLAFAILALAKYNLARGGSGGWVNLEWKYIFQIADLRGVTCEKQNLMLHELDNSGLIKITSKLSSLSLQVLFLEDGESAIVIDDINEAGKIYQQHMGRRYVKCQKCGKRVAVTNGRTKRCPDCAEEHNKMMARERMKKWKSSQT